MPSILLLFLGDPKTDRRLQNFERFFRQSGWDVGVLTHAPVATRGPRRFMSYDRELKRIVQSKHADVVMACDLYSLGAAAVMKRRGLAQRMVYDAREVYTELPTIAHRPLVKWAWKRYERRYIDDADLMLVTGPHDADAILRVQRGIPRTVLVRNLPWITDLHRDRSLLTKFGPSEDVTTLIYVGGLQKGRGLFKLIQAMHAFEEQLLIVGAGVLEQELRDLTKEYMVDDRVKFAGPVPAEEALALVAASDVGVSLIEPISKSYELALPSKVFEYMMAGIPVVCGKLLQVMELFEKEEWIEFVDINDDADIARGIRAAIAKTKRPELRQREQALAKTHYHFEAGAEPLLKLLNR